MRAVTRNPAPSRSAATVATVLRPSERTWVEAAAGGYFSALHARDVPEAIRVVRDRSVTAVLVSPHSVPQEQIAGVARLVKDFPGVSTVAVLSAHDAAGSERLLQLGASGVRRLIDLSRRDGWQRLRSLVAQGTSPVSARILAHLVPAMGTPTTEVVRFFELLVWIAPDTPTVRLLCRKMQVQSSTFMSRFFRAAIPSPKRYLAAVRLIHAAALFEVPGLSIADVAYRLEYSSPQSFGRHVRATVGMTAGEFRRRFTFASALEDFLKQLILPFQAAFRSFRPL